MTRALLVMIALASVARADVWKRAIEGRVAGTEDPYVDALADGDSAAMRADAKGQTARSVTKLVDEAVDFYKAAAAARPTEGEPYFRIAAVVSSFFTDCAVPGRGMAPPPTCQGRAQDRARAQQVLAALEEFEKRAPIDPRVGEALFGRAILRTKLVDGAKDPKPLLEAALADYRTMIDRSDGLSMIDLEGVWGNMAETYMMLGRMEESIDAYRVALRMGAGAATAFGLAVALDRDGSPAEALEVIRAQSESSLLEFLAKLRNGEVFFVPAGEEYYYIGLIFEAFDRPGAIDAWRRFIASGANPQYHARAKQHIDALQTQSKTQPRSLPRQTISPYELMP